MRCDPRLAPWAIILPPLTGLSELIKPTTMQFTFKQKIFALLVASLFLRFVFFAVESGDSVSQELSPKTSYYGEDRLNTNPPPPAPVMTVKPIVIEEAVKLFHEQFNQTQFDAIYADAGKGVRDFQTRDAFVRKLSDQRNELGAVISSKRTYINQNIGYGKSTVIVADFQTVFANGESKREGFFWRIVKGKPQLDYYTVS